jgi:uncharacterized membrane protein
VNSNSKILFDKKVIAQSLYPKIVEIVFLFLNIPFLYAILRSFIVSNYGILKWLPDFQFLTLIGLIFSSPVLIMSGLTFIFAFKRRVLGGLFILIGLVWLGIIFFEVYSKSY